MADTLVKKPKLIVGTQSQVEAEMGADDIGFATDVEFYTAKQIDELLEKSGGASLPILMPTWSDHLLNDVSWLRADTFSWQSGDVYKAAYEHLVDDFNAATSDGEISFLVCNNYEYYRDVANDHVGQIYPYAWTTKDVSAIDTTLYSDTENPNTGDYVSTSFKQGGVETQIESVGRGVKTDTIGDITITYYQAQDGHKICLPDQEANLSALYEATGAADYYLLDTTNKQFKLPRKQKRTLIQAVKNTDGTWYNLYSDGWVEQGGELPLDSGWMQLPVTMNKPYAPTFKIVTNRTGVSYDCQLFPTDAQADKFYYYQVAPEGGVMAQWQISGYAAESAYASAGMNLEYYYVGNFTQEAIEQTAGLNAELFNGKADVATVNGIDSRVDSLEGYDYVVESQLPTASNSYTWYRKYKSGWVEQGGQKSAPKGASEISFPIPMSNKEYTASVNALVESSDARIAQVQTGKTAEHLNVMTNNSFTVYWIVFGMAA